MHYLLQTRERDYFTLFLRKKFEYMREKCVKYATLFCELTEPAFIRHKLFTLEY
jgi:hypothetical protein